MEFNKGQKHVFIDWFGVEPGYGTPWHNKVAMNHLFIPYGIRIKIHRPVLETEPAILPDRQWEGMCLGAYATFIREDGIYRAWYECIGADETSDMKSYLAYAESEDGMEWKKPVLGAYEYKGSTENNIICRSHGSSVLKDDALMIGGKYKKLRVEYNSGKTFDTHRIYFAQSEDGIIWNEWPGEVCKNPADTQNILVYNNMERRYEIYTRQCIEWESFLRKEAENPPRRAVCRLATTDFKNWEKPEMLITVNPNDPPDWDIYTNSYHSWPGTPNAYLMFLGMYRRTDDCIDIHLALSRNGTEWYRPTGREALIPNGPYGSFNSCSIYATCGILPVRKGQWCIYVRADPYGHNIPYGKLRMPYSAYYRAVIREDGFCSVRADSKGRFWTGTIEKFEGEHLYINAVVPYSGYIRAGLYDDATGEEIKGFGLDSCRELNGDVLWEKLAWSEGDNLGKLHGRKFRICFDLFKSDIYGFKFE